jgi:signal transduction histidine kinase
VGRIEITGSENQFTPISSREGLKNTSAFNQLRNELFLDVLRKLERFVVEGLEWDTVPRQLRQELKNSDGLDWKNTPEQYTETWERKKQRIALSIMTLIGTSPEKTIKFWFNPALLEGLYANKQEEVKNLLAELEGIEPKIIDTQLTKNLSKIKVFIEKREKEIEEAKSVASDLRLEVAEKDEKINKIEGEKETYRAQTLFYQQVTSLDVKQLLSYHHQINLDAIIANNYNKKAIKAIRDLPNSKEILTYLQKASLANRRIIAIAQYAIKANFRSATKKELTDIPAFFEQYLVNVAKDFIAAGLTLEVSNTVEEPFEIKASRIELTILIDNIISNASKAQSRKLSVNISKISTDRLKISFIDDGKGLSKELPSIESMFEMGITTTAGSGFGLYDAKNIVENIDGNISAIPINSKGMEIRIEVNR